MPSSLVSHFNYNIEDQSLIVYYVSGIVYKYKGVSEKISKEMKASISKGQHLNYKIKPNFEFKKLEIDEQ